MNSRVVSAIVIVVLLHAALIALLITVRNEPPARALESRSITAELLSPGPAAAPPALQSAAPLPNAVPPAPHVKPKAESYPAPLRKTRPAPSPLVDLPSPDVLATPQQAPAAAAAPATNASPSSAGSALAAAPSSHETLAIAAPKDVAHLDCSITKPDYPALSQRRGEAGTAYVHFVVGLTGKIENIELKKSSGFSRLDDAALAAMRTSACRPYVENGQPLRAAYTQPFTFGLND